jgi:hypothetical protein
MKENENEKEKGKVVDALLWPLYLLENVSNKNILSS